MFGMGADPQSCSYPASDGLNPSGWNDEAVVNRVCGEFQPTASEVGAPFSEPVPIDRVRGECLYVGAGTIYPSQCDPCGIGEGDGGIGSVSVEWALGIDGEGEPALASEGGGIVLFWCKRGSGQKEISTIRF